VRYAVLFWWFLLLGNHPVVVGPFYDLGECEEIQNELPDHTTFTPCWSDVGQRPIVRR